MNNKSQVQVEKSFFPEVNFWGKNSNKEGIYLEQDQIHFEKCLGKKANQSKTITISDIKYIKHLAKYKFFVLEGLAINEPHNVIVLADQDERTIAEIDIFRFKKNTLLNFLDQFREAHAEIEFDQQVKTMLSKRSLASINWKFFLAVLRGLRTFVVIFFIYTILLIIRYFRRILFSILMLSLILISGNYLFNLIF